MPNRPRVLIPALILLFATLPLLVGCPAASENRRTVAPGVTYIRDAPAGVYLIEVDLLTAKVRPVVVSANFERKKNNFVGDAKTVLEWAREAGAVGGINAGFFGETYDAEGRRKQTIGLLVGDGKVIAPATFVASTRFPGEKFLRSAVGFAPDGTPDIAWATGRLGDLPRAHDAPVNPASSGVWRVRSGVSCGPSLFVGGARRITDREERLVSKGKLARAFVAYDRADGKPRHLILGRADAMEYADLADYLTAHYARAYGTAPHAAMCLDGGPSAQVVYRDPTTAALADAAPTGVQVPTAIILVGE
jgi:hypothetical protein